MSESEIIADAKIAAAIRGQAQEGKLRCAAAFRIAEELDMTPLAVGQTADALEVRLARCNWGCSATASRGASWSRPTTWSQSWSRPSEKD